MGIILRQGIISAVFLYLGIAIGFLTTGVLFPKYLTTEQVGVVTLIVTYSLLFGTFGNLGLQSVIIRLFPYFQSNTSRKHNGLIAIVNLFGILGFGVAYLVFILFKGKIIDSSDNPELVSRYFKYIPYLILSTLFFLSFDSYNRALKRSVMGLFLKEFIQRICILISLVLYLYFKDFDLFVTCYVVSLSLPTVLILFNLIHKKNFTLKPKLGYIKNGLGKKMLDTGAFGILLGFGNIIVQRIDIVMISMFTSLSLTGIYGISLFFGNVVSSPSRAISRISIVLISDAFKNNDFNLVKKIYSKVSLNQFIVGSIIFTGIIINFHNIFKILPAEYIEGKYVMVFFGLLALTNMIFGITSAIISISKYHRYTVWFMIAYIVIIITSNLILIPLYGITGAALASFLSTLIYRLLMYFFVKRKYKLSIFSYKYFLIIFFVIVAIMLNSFLPVFSSLILDILFRSTIFSCLYLFLLLVFNISEDITITYYSIIDKLKKIIK